jgi:hypothetical protein
VRRSSDFFNLNIGVVAAVDGEADNGGSAQHTTRICAALLPVHILILLGVGT